MKKTNELSKEQIKIGRFIKELRERKGLTQIEFAKKLNTSQSAIARMERGEQNFSTEMLSKIGQVLNQEIITLSKGTVSFKIEGQQKLSGSVSVKASKNSAVALLAASLLNKGKTTLKNMPRIEEVYRLIEVLQSIGVSVEWKNSDVTIEPPKKLVLEKLDQHAAIKTRSILLFLGPLIHLFENFKLPYAGGCKLGKRTVRPHLFALEKCGVDINATKNNYHITAKNLKPNEIVMYESSDTGTENVLMAAAKIEGKTVIKYATSNYMVQDLCHFLELLGVKIEGIGTTTLTVYGVKEINQNIIYQPSEDPIEAMFFLTVAAVTKSTLTIERCPLDFLELELLKLEKMGFKYKIIKEYTGANGHVRLGDIKTSPSRLTALEEKIYGRPYPGLNIDNLPFFVPIATQAEGETLIHDWVYEGRAIYYTEMNKLGTNITLADPHRVLIKGPTELRSAVIQSPPALRPAVIIFIAMLAARGTSILKDVYSINRGYEDLAERLNKIGAKIEVLKGL